MIIICSIVFLLIGFVISYFVFAGKKNSVNEKLLTELKADNERLVQKCKREIDPTKNETNNKITGANQNLETLYKGTTAQDEKLDLQLKKSINGNIEESIKEQLECVNNLKKKIKELEDVLEENEDDIKDLKKKLRNKDSDLDELQTSYEKEQNVSKQLSSELTSVKQKLEENMDELNLKMGSLTFIQDILSAKECNNTDIKKLNDHISVMRSFIKDQYMDSCNTLKEHISFGKEKEDFNHFRDYWNQRFDEWESVIKKSWIDRKTTIAFVGEFSAGKTSIINRILSQDDPSVPQLPVSTKATTAIPTYIASGPIISYQFVTPDDKLKTIQETTFKKISKEVLAQVKGVLSLIKYFVMTCKNPNLEGLSILDTPGFNSNDKEDKERTIDVINECDALFWVFDINAGTVNRSSIEIIKEKLNKPLYVVINKVDTKSDAEIKKVESLINETLSKAGLSVQQFIRFSSKNPLTDIMNPIKLVKHPTEKEKFIKDIEENIAGFLNQLDGKCKDANKEYCEAEKKAESINQEFTNKINSLQDLWQNAVDIPHFEKHLFKKDNYEMSQSEYSELCNIPNKSIDEVKKMSQTSDDMITSGVEIQKTWLAYRRIEAAYQRINDYRTQFKKISQNLK